MPCIVVGCRSHYGENENTGENETISFHGFPKTEDIRKQWFENIGRSENQYKKYWKVCSRHFKPECFRKDTLIRALLKENVVPTLYLPSMPRITKVFVDHPRPHMASEQKSRMCVSILSIPQENNSMTTMNAVYEGRIDKLQKEVQKLEQIAKNRLQKLNCLKHQTRRLKKNNSYINMRMTELLENEKLDKDYFKMLECIKSNKMIERSRPKGSTKYSLELKKFAVSLYCLSPKAYNVLQDELKDVLPPPHTILKLYRRLTCNPEANTEV